MCYSSSSSTSLYSIHSDTMSAASTNFVSFGHNSFKRARCHKVILVLPPDFTILSVSFNLVTTSLSSARPSVCWMR